MNRHVSVLLLAVLATIGLAGVAGTSVSDAEAEGGSGSVQQANVQVAVNIAIYCPDVQQSIGELAANISITDVQDGGLSQVAVGQVNLQVAYNVAVYSPGATQLIGQAAGNAAGITTTQDAVTTVQQFNSSGVTNLSVLSDGSTQAVQQEAVNVAATTGSETLTSAVDMVVYQSNVAYVMNLCLNGEAVESGAGMMGAWLELLLNPDFPGARQVGSTLWDIFEVSVSVEGCDTVDMDFFSNGCPPNGPFSPLVTPNDTGPSSAATAEEPSASSQPSEGQKPNRWAWWTYWDQANG